MSGIITSLPVDVTTNNEVKIGTRDRDIISASIKAPDINRNLLTQEHVIKNCDLSKTAACTVSKQDGYFHYDFNKLTPTLETLFYLPLEMLNLKSNTEYTLTMQFFNVKNGIRNYNFEFVLDAKPSYKVIDGYIDFTKDKIYTKTFTTSGCTCIYGLMYRNRRMGKFNGVLDLKIISLVEGDTPLLTETPSLDSYSKQSLITSNECNSLGSYSISPYIRKHIQTVEHNITKQENLYNINWR